MTSLILMFKKSFSIDRPYHSCIVSKYYSITKPLAHMILNGLWILIYVCINIEMYSLLPECHFHIFRVREDAHEGYVRGTLLALLHANSVSPNVPFVNVFCFARGRVSPVRSES